MDVNPEHEHQCAAFLRFSAFKRRQHLREVDYSFEEVKDMNLFEVRPASKRARDVHRVYRPE